MKCAGVGSAAVGGELVEGVRVLIIIANRCHFVLLCIYPSISYSFAVERIVEVDLSVCEWGMGTERYYRRERNLETQ